MWQGSTSVYSRKVEHVYQLVLRTIDFLAEQKQQKNAASKGKNGDDDATGEEVTKENICTDSRTDRMVTHNLGHTLLLQVALVSQCERQEYFKFAVEGKNTY